MLAMVARLAMLAVLAMPARLAMLVTLAAPAMLVMPATLAMPAIPAVLAHSRGLSSTNLTADLLPAQNAAGRPVGTG